MSSTEAFATGKASGYDLDCSSPTVDAKVSDPGLPWHLARIGVKAAWARTRGNPLVRVAILDTGIAVGHPVLSANVHPGWNFDHGSDDPRPSPVAGGGWTSDAHHGTACASIVAGAGEATGTVGVAPACSLVPVRLRRFAPSSDWERSIPWAAGHADVLLCAWTIAPCATLERALTRAIATGRGGRGLVCVAAAGNEAGDVGFPARLPVVLGVGASDESDRLVPSSNAGAGLNLVAPGWTSAGGGLDVADLRLPGRTGLRPGLGPDPFGGTSAAASVVAGVAALVLSLAPAATSADVHDILRRSAAPASPTRMDRRTIPADSLRRVDADAATALGVGLGGLLPPDTIAR